MIEFVKWLVVIVVLAGNFYFSTTPKSDARSNQSVVINSIVQRPDGVFFDVSVNGGPHQIVSAPNAQGLLQRICPSIHFAPGVMQ